MPGEGSWLLDIAPCRSLPGIRIIILQRGLASSLRQVSCRGTRTSLGMKYSQMVLTRLVIHPRACAPLACTVHGQTAISVDLKTNGKCNRRRRWEGLCGLTWLFFPWTLLPSFSISRDVLACPSLVVSHLSWPVSLSHSYRLQLSSLASDRQ